MQIRRIAKGCFPKNMSLEMVSGVHRTDFNRPVLAGTKFLPALFFFFFFDLQCLENAKRDYLGTGRPNREARSSPAIRITSQLPFKDDSQGQRNPCNQLKSTCLALPIPSGDIDTENAGR